jgi:hypothetical protein
LESETEGSNRETRAPYLRMHHLGVLTTILHRCLLEGDIQRANRAWAMLLRAQVNGKGVNIRSSGYWGIGAELLMRGGERRIRGGGFRQGHESEEPESGSSDSESGQEGGSKDGESYGATEGRWGTAAGLEKTKEYFERLILQHPYKRQYHNSVSALDFWPAMLGCEVYGIQFEQKEALKKIEAEEEDEDVHVEDEMSDEDETVGHDDPNEYMVAQQRKEARQQDRRKEVFWRKRDEVRQTALSATQKVAARMDELMTSPPFSDSHALHRLRGMIALYIGDLSVPALLDEEEDEDRDDQDLEDSRRNIWGTDEKLAGRRLLIRQRRVEHERGLVQRAEERLRARKAFEKALKDGGRVDVEFERLSERRSMS